MNSQRYDFHFFAVAEFLLRFESQSEYAFYQRTDFLFFTLSTFGHDADRMTETQHINAIKKNPVVFSQVLKTITHAECRHYFSKMHDFGNRLVLKKVSTGQVNHGFAAWHQR